MYPYLVRVNNLSGDPTQKQIEYAEKIHLLLGAGLPEVKTKQAYSDFINKYARKYKEAAGNRI